MKRTMFNQGGQDRYGGESAPEEAMDRPQQATAAQLAKRKIAQAKGSRRPRSESPLTNTGSIFDQSTQNGFVNNNNNNAMSNFNPTPSFTFATNGSSQSFGSGGGSFTFGGQAAPNNSFGGQTQQSTPNTNSFTFASPTSNLQFGQSNGNTSFGQNGDTPKPFGNTSTGFTFGQKTDTTQNPFGQKSETQNAFGQKTDTTQNTFGQKPETSVFGSQPAAVKPATNSWTEFTSQKPGETPKANGFGPSTSIFSQNGTNGVFAGLGQEKTPNFKFTAQPEDNDMSMMSPENTPQKQSTGMFGGVNGAAKETQSEVGKGPSLFDRISKSPPKEPSTSLFAGSSAPSNLFSQGAAGQAAASTNLFSQGAAPGLFSQGAAPSLSQGAAPSLFSQGTAGQTTTPTNLLSQGAAGETTAPKNLFSQAKTDSTPKSLFSPPTDATSTSTNNLFSTNTTAPAPTNNLFSSNAAPAPTNTPIAATPASSQPLQQSSMAKTKPEHYTGIRELNEALLQHLKTQDLNKDLSSIFQYYQSEVSKLQTTAAKSNLGNSILGKPQAPAPTYPSLPENASATSKLFQAALDKPTEPANTNGFTPSTTSLFASKPETTSNSLFTAKPDTPSLFAPKPAESTKPAGFNPTVTPGSQTSFLSSFGQQAEKNAEKERKRRRDEDFDSDDENEAEWEQRDAEEQAAKRSKIEEAAKKSTGFKFVPSGTPSTSIFSKPADVATPNLFSKPADNNSSSISSKPADSASSASLFSKPADNTSSSIFSKPADGTTSSLFNKPADNTSSSIFSKATDTTSSSIFSKPTDNTSSSLFSKSANDTSTSIFGKPADNTASAEDHTWKQGTPIKFGGTTTSATSTTPTFNFGSTTPAPSLFATPKPASSFGQSSTTPAPTTDTAEDGDAAPPEPQLDDMAVLLQSEKDESDILFYVEKSKSRKLEARPSEGGSEKLTWIDKGHGPIWILRNKTTGKTRVLQKIKDSGRTAMNFTLLPGNESLYKHEGMNGKAVMATFIDHLGNKDSNKPSQWAVIVGKKEDAAEIARILREEQKKA